MSVTELRSADIASIDMQALLKAEQENRATASGGTVTAQAQANMLAGNFVSATSEPSRYITARIDGLQAQKTSDNKLDLLLASMPALQGGSQGSKSYVERYLDGLKAQRRLRQIVDQEVAAQNIETLEDAREDLERKAQDAVAPEGSSAASAQGAAPGGDGAAAPAQDVAVAAQVPLAAADAAAVAPAVTAAATAHVDVVV